MLRKYLSTKILIIDNELLVATDLAYQLLLLGYDDTCILNDLKNLERVIVDQDPDAIIINSDFMKYGGGILVADDIIKHHDTPIIFLTTSISAPKCSQSNSINRIACIHKPFNQHSILKGVNSVLT